MAEATGGAGFGQEVVFVPCAISGGLIDFVFALLPGLVHFHALLQPIQIGGGVCHSPAPAAPHHVGSY